MLKGAKLVLTNPQGLKHRARCRGKPEAGSFGASGVCDFPGCSLSPPGVRGRGDGTRGQVPGEAPPPASGTPNEWLPLPSPQRFPSLSLISPPLSPLFSLWQILQSLGAPFQHWVEMPGPRRGHKKVRWGEVRKGREREDRLKLRKGSGGQWGAHSCTEGDPGSCSASALLCCVPWNKSLTLSGASFDYLYIERVITVACLLSRREVCIWGWV